MPSSIPFFSQHHRASRSAMACELSHGATGLQENVRRLMTSKRLKQGLWPATPEILRKGNVVRSMLIMLHSSDLQRLAASKLGGFAVSRATLCRLGENSLIFSFLPSCSHITSNIIAARSLLCALLGYQSPASLRIPALSDFSKHQFNFVKPHQ